MKIGLLQVDGEHPNIALMQISAYHEAIGDTVHWYEGPLFDYVYDKIYASKIFDFSELPPLPSHALVGGTGINFTNTLPEDIALMPPSYTLYPKCRYHVGFSMKGCRFRCKFCCVPQKEGRPKHNSNINDLLLNPNGGNRLMLMDNDFFGSPNWKEDLNTIIDLKLKICFVQGLNIRIITTEQAELLAKCNFYNAKFKKKYLSFAWDRFNDGRIVFEGIKRCNDAGIPSNKMQFFILIGYDTTHEQNLERVIRLHQAGCLPFVMPYNKFDPYQKAFTRWVNMRSVFNSCTWDNYKYKIKN